MPNKKKSKELMSQEEYQYFVERYEGLVFEFTALLLQSVEFNDLMNMDANNNSGLTDNVPSIREVINQATKFADVYLTEENWRHLDRNAKNN